MNKDCTRLIDVTFVSFVIEMCKSYDVIKVSVYYTIDLLNANNTIVCLRRLTIFFDFVLMKNSKVSFS